MQTDNEKTPEENETEEKKQARRERTGNGCEIRGEGRNQPKLRGKLCLHRRKRRM